MRGSPLADGKVGSSRKILFDWRLQDSDLFDLWEMEKRLSLPTLIVTDTRPGISIWYSFKPPK